MSKPIHNDQLFEDVRQLILSARQQVVKSINVTMVATYFEIGKRIVQEERAYFKVSHCQNSRL